MPYSDRERQKAYQREWVRRKRAEKVRHISSVEPRRGIVSFFPNKQIGRPQQLTSREQALVEEMGDLGRRLEAALAHIEWLESRLKRIEDGHAIYASRLLRVS